MIDAGEFQLQKHKEDGWDISKLLYLANPIEMTFYNPNVTLQDKQNLIVFYGRLSPEKNVSSLITAFANLIKYPQFSNYKLLIIGDGDDKQHCIELAGELIGHPPSQHYEFLGRRTPKEIKNILFRAKLSVLPSLLQETFGLTIVESMLACTPALVPNISELNITARHFGGFIFTNLTDSLIQILNEYDTYFNDFMHKRANKLPALFDNAYLKELVKIYGGGGNVVYIILHSLCSPCSLSLSSWSALHTLPIRQEYAA